MYPSTGRVGFRRSIDGPGPYQVDEHGVPIICLNFHWQEVCCRLSSRSRSLTNLCASGVSPRALRCLSALKS